MPWIIAIDIEKEGSKIVVMIDLSQQGKGIGNLLPRELLIAVVGKEFINAGLRSLHLGRGTCEKSLILGKS